MSTVGWRVATLFSQLVNIYQLLVLVWCVLSWVPRRPGSLLDDAAQALESLCAPWINLFRRWIPPVGGIDFSPVVAILALQLVRRLVLYILV